jgi:flavorubredoxin
MKKDILVGSNAYWIGYVDDRKVPFHRLVLEKGTTYNSYLLKTEKPTIIDTVDISFGREYVENLKELINLEEIKYIVINHVEPDHSGALPVLANKAKNAVIVATELGVKELKEMYKLHNREFLIVKDGDTLDIGGKTLKFLETPYLHTEETMVTYAIEDKTLYPCDIFSTHVATYDLFNDLATEDITTDFEVYYSLIMNPHKNYVQDMIEKIRDLDIEIIAPSHGYILRSNAKKYIDSYDNMSKASEVNKKAAIVFSTMTSNTKKLANYIGEALGNKGIEATIINVKEDKDVENAKEAILNSDILFFGSSTRYGDMVGKIEEVLKGLNNMDLSSKVGVAFGSYGWSGEAIEVINDYLKETNLKVLESSLIIKSTGMDNVQAPIRVKFAVEEEVNKFRQSVNVISEMLVG